jgi:16S rRNA U516 pseudouridylate synthase RsuA-like enzyme
MLHKPRGFVSQDSDAATARAQQRLAIKLLTWSNQARQHGHAVRSAGGDGAAPLGIRDQVEPCRLKGLAVVGRLDAQSSGLLLFSQDGNLARSILGSGSEAGEKLE